MKYPLIIILCIFCISCGESKKEEGINLAVTHNGDTLSHFYYGENSKYQFYDSLGADFLFSDKNSLLRIPGQFKFGINGKDDQKSKCLVIVKVPTLAQDFPVKERVTFLEQEYLTPEYKIEPYANYLDSAQTPIRQYESYMVIDQVKNDTILFQEVSFYLLNGNLFTNYIVYENSDIREEMRLLLVNVANKLKQSVKDREK